MAYSIATYTGNGSTSQFAVPFPFLDRAHVVVSVAGSPVTPAWVHDGLVQITPAPINGATVQIARNSNRNGPLVDFQDTAQLTEAILDLANKQAIYIAQEAFDASPTGDYSAQFVAWVAAATAAANAAAASEANAAVSASAASSSASASAVSAATAVAAAGSVTTKVDRATGNPLTATFRATLEPNVTYDLAGSTVSASLAHVPAGLVTLSASKVFTQAYHNVGVQGTANAVAALTDIKLVEGGATTGGKMYGIRSEFVGSTAALAESAAGVGFRVKGLSLSSPKQVCP